MTARQRKILNYIAAYQAAHDGVSPSIREMAEALLIRSIGGLSRQLRVLEAHGLIHRRPGASRSITIIPDSLAHIPTDRLLDELHRRRVTVGRQHAPDQFTNRDSIVHGERA